MFTLKIISLLILSYLIGSIPWGYFLVRWTTGKNVQDIESGRTGGTNTMRAAGLIPGLVTTLLDILKSASIVWGLKFLYPDLYWLHILGPVMAVIGHNYSIYLIRKDPSGKITLGGGAGGTPAVGGLIGLWWPLGLIIIPAGAVIIFVIGYASLATMTMPILGSLILLWRAVQLGTPWEYALFGILAEIFILWSLRPNIQRLLNGTERIVGLRARKKHQ